MTWMLYVQHYNLPVSEGKWSWFPVTPWPVDAKEIMRLLPKFRGRCRAVARVLTKEVKV